MNTHTPSQQVLLSISVAIIIPALVYLSYYVEKLALEALLASYNRTILEVSIGESPLPITFAMLIALVFNLSKILLGAFMAWQLALCRPFWLGSIAKGVLVVFSGFCTLYVVSDELAAPNLTVAHQRAISQLEQLADEKRARESAYYHEAVNALQEQQSLALDDVAALYQPRIDAAQAGMDKERGIGGTASIGPRYRSHEVVYNNMTSSQADELRRVREDGSREAEQLRNDRDEAIKAIDDWFAQEVDALDKGGMLRDFEAQHEGVQVFASMLSQAFSFTVKPVAIVASLALLLCVCVELIPIAVCAYAFGHLLMPNTSMSNKQG